MKKKSKIIIASILVIFVVISIALVFVYKNNKEGDVEVLADTKKKVEIQNIEPQDSISVPLIASGVVEPKQHSIIRSLTPGNIVYLVPVGEKVYVGQPLFRVSDSGVENNFFNSMQNLAQTKVVSNQRIQQAELGVNSAKARLSLAEVQYNNTILRNDQSMRAVVDTSIVAYNSAYNTLSQALNFLSEGRLQNFEFVYKDIATPYSQVKNDADFMLLVVSEEFLKLSYPVEELKLKEQLNQEYQSLLSTKNLIDKVAILLQNAIANDNYTESRLASDKAIVVGYQSQINQHIATILNALNGLENTKINNDLTLSQSESQVNLSKIDLSNAEITLKNAEEGATLESNIASSQLDNASYSYGNLSLPAPFSGTVINHYVEPGDQVSPGQSIIEIGDLTIAEIKVEINSSLVEGIKLGDNVLINEKYAGFVADIDPIGDLQSGKISVSIESNDKELALMGGNSVEVGFTLNYPELGMIVVPIKSVIIESSGNYVFVLVDNKVERRSVTLGKIFGDKVVVLDGLNIGESMILKNGVFVAEGDEVEVIK